MTFEQWWLSYQGSIKWVEEGSPQAKAAWNYQQTIIDELQYLTNLQKDRIERQQATIHKLEEWIAAIADDHPQIPDWIQQSARSLLAQEQE